MQMRESTERGVRGGPEGRGVQALHTMRKSNSETTGFRSDGRESMNSSSLCRYCTVQYSISHARTRPADHYGL